MKKKSFQKIRLNRETLRHLDPEVLGAAVGGVTTSHNPTACGPDSGCVSCDDTCVTCTRRPCPL